MALTDLVIGEGKVELVSAGVAITLDEAQLSGTITRSLDGASSLEFEVYDPAHALLAPRLLNNAADLRWEGMVFRLCRIEKVQDKTRVQFEDRAAAVLRGFTKPMVAIRSANMTRERFVSGLLAEARKELPGLRFMAPSTRTRTPITTSKKAKTPQTRRVERDYGLSPQARLTVQGKAATREQIQNMQAVLDVGVSRKVSRKVLVAAVATIIVESWAKNLTYGDRDSVGLFQQRPSQGWPASRDIGRDATAFYQAAVKLDAQKPNLPVGDLCQGVQRSAFPDRYAKWASEAEAAVTAYMGAGEADNVTAPASSGGSYEFRRGGLSGEREDTWESTGRLAEEVQWRRFIVGDVFYFTTDQELLRSQPVLVAEEGQRGIDWIDYTIDIGEPVSTATLEGLATGMVSEPGTVVEIRGSGPADGRWLVSEWTRDIFSPQATTTLTSPRKPLPEPPADKDTPAGESGGMSVAEGGVLGGLASGPRGALAAASAISQEGKPYGAAGHTGDWSSSRKASSQDCSSSSSLSLHAGGMMGKASGPQVSDWFLSWGEAGKGKDMTVWVKPGTGAAGHVFIEWHNPKARFDTGGPRHGKGRGARLFTGDQADRDKSGFTPRHWPGT